MLVSTAGDTLRHARWAKRWAIRKAAAEAKVAPKTIVKVEKGKQVDGSIVYALCDAYGIDPLPLFTEAPQPEAVGE